MKPPIEYRPIPAKRRMAPTKAERDAIKALSDGATSTDELLKHAADYIIVRRNRANYNAYMRAYRAKKKAEKAP